MDTMGITPMIYLAPSDLVDAIRMLVISYNMQVKEVGENQSNHEESAVILANSEEKSRALSSPIADPILYAHDASEESDPKEYMELESPADSEVSFSTKLGISSHGSDSPSTAMAQSLELNYGGVGDKR